MSEVTTQSTAGWLGAALPSGTVLAGRYRIERFIAAGGMGEVYAAHDLSIDEQVALKVIRAGTTHLEEEVRLSRRVTHPNVCRVFDLGRAVHEGRELRFITMELLDGAPLSRTLRERRLTAAEVRKVFVGVAAALESAHASGVVHGDLKPGNVVVTRAGRVVVTDFGLARPVGAEGAAAQGTPAYATPEHLQQVALSPASDRYAFGVMLYELVSGVLPFRGQSAGDTARQRVERAPDLSVVPTRFRALIAACLELDPARRPARLCWPALTSGRERFLAAVGLALVCAGGVALWSRPTPAFTPAAIELRTKVSCAACTDGWYERAVRGLVAERLERTNWVHVVERGGEPVELDVSGEPGQVSVTLRWREYSSAGHAPSVLQAVEAATPSLLRAMGHQGDAPASSLELTAMKETGCPSIEAWRSYVEAQNEYWHAEHVESEVITQQLERQLKRTPTWPRLWVMLILGYGLVGERAESAFRRAREHVTPGLDPEADDFFLAADAWFKGDTARAIATLRRSFAATGNLMTGWFLTISLLRQDRIEERLAVAKRLFRLRPDLQFAGAGVLSLYSLGRPGDALALLDEWAGVAPHQENMVILQANARAFAERSDAAIWVERLFWLFGESAGRHIDAVPPLMALGQWDAVRRHTMALSTRGDISRTWAQMYNGQIAVLEGNLSGARDAFIPALADGRGYGMEVPFTQTLVELARLDHLAGRKDQERTHLLDLAHTVRGLGEEALSKAISLEAALTIGASNCEAVHELSNVLRLASELVARRYLLRMGHRFGCVPCEAVVAEGLGPREPSTAALTTLGLCAQEVGQRVLARKALTRAAMSFGLLVTHEELESAYDTMIARYHLARLDLAEGRTEAGERRLAQFVDAWDDTEVDIPELTAAREQLAALRARRP